MEKSISSLSDYLNCTINCTCGHIHTSTIKHIVLSEHAHEQIPQLLKQNNYQNIFVFADTNTYQVAGENVITILKDASFSVSTYLFKDSVLIPDEHSIGSLLTAIPDNAELIIAVGTGTLNDLGKYISHKLKLPFYVVATAPSMDGFASNVSCLILNHMKTTIETHIPEAIIADLHVLATAPNKLIAAGVGDILGKYICLLDWKLSNIINNEYHCMFVESIVRNSILVIVNTIDSLKTKDITAIKNVMEGLILSGIAMSYVGNSRPASGSEHHLSHYWELNFLANQKLAVLHGIKVGIGTVEAVRLYEFLLDAISDTKIPDFEHARLHADTFSFDKWALKMQEIYGLSADEVIKMEEIHHKNNPKTVLHRLKIIEEKWPEIAETIKSYLPDSSTLITMLEKVGASTKPYDEGIRAELVYHAVLYAKELRNRYGLLQLLYDLGYNEQFATKLELLSKNKL